LHYFSFEEETYPRRCYCVAVKLSLEDCVGYEPKENLEYLEWINEKRSEK
jgi:hypothetical protein